MIRVAVLSVVAVLNTFAKAYREFDQAYNDAMDRHYESYLARLSEGDDTVEP